MTRNPTTTLDQEISVLKRYTELLSIELPQDEPSLMAFLRKLLNDVRPLGRPPLTGQALKEVTIKHLHALDPNRYSPQELMEALEKTNALAPRVQAIYESYRTELGLTDYLRLIESRLRHDQLSRLVNVPCLTPIWAISDLIHRLEGLKHKREREAKTPPQAGQGEDKTAQERQGERKDKEILACRWEVDEDGQEVYCGFGGKRYGPVKLSRVGYDNSLLFKLFFRLYRQWKENKERVESKGWVTVSTLEKFWDPRPGYKDFVADTISKLRTTLKEELKKCGLEIEGKIIKPNHPKKVTKYKLI